MNEKFFLGYPIEFKNLCLVYPPKIKDVVSNNLFSVLLKLLTLSQEEIEDDWNKRGLDLKTILTPFELLLNNGYNSKELDQLLRQAFEFFIHEPVTPLYDQKMIVIGDLATKTSLRDMRVLREEDFFDFQNLVRESCGGKPIEKPDPDEDPRIHAMKAKARYRDKIKAKRAEKSGKAINFTTSLASICCMNVGLNPLNIGEVSYAAFQLLIVTYREKEQYEVDIKSLLAGADSKKIHPVYWIHNLD